MVTKVQRERAVLDALMSAGKPVNSKQICRAIKEPWYDKPTSFRASVSSTLGLLRSKGLVACQEIRGEPREHMRWRDTERRWFLTAAGMLAFGSVSGFHKGGVVGKKPSRLVGDRVQHDLWPHQRRTMDRILSLDLAKTVTVIVSVKSRLNARPRTDDMKQMLDDLGITPPPTFAEYKERIQREIVRGFGIPRELL